jgi:glyoxylase-like metal-dependent hydrolase (beta-lactamase superfamily II)
VGTDKAVVVIDPGPAEDAHLDALTTAIGGAQVVAIACTHTHRDHSPAAAPLRAHRRPDHRLRAADHGG